MTLILIAISGLALVWLTVIIVHGLICYGRWRRHNRQRQIQNTPLLLKVIYRHDFNEQRFMVRLATVNNTVLPKFNPGQFLTVCITQKPSTVISKRRYSISNWQRHPLFYELCIKQVAGGNISNYLFDKLNVGSAISILPPAGNAFPVLQKPVEIILIAGGVGISPVRSILHYHLQQSPLAQISLFYSAAKQHDLCYLEELSELSCQNKHFHFYPSLTQGDDDWTGRTGRILISDIVNAVIKPRQAVFILCGPEAMQDNLITDLQTQGIKSEQLFFEHFGLGKTVIPERIFEIELTSGEQFQYDAQPTLLVALEENSIPVVGSCRTGECGDCRVRLLTGKVSQFKPITASIADDEILPCCCVPATNLSLEI